MALRRLRRTAAALLVVLAWSSCSVVIKASQAEVPPLLFAAIRALLAGAALLAVAAWAGRLRPARGQWGWILLLGLSNTTLGFAGMFLSVPTAGTAIPGVLQNSQALLVAPFAAAWFGERLTKGRILALLVGISGTALIVPGDEGGPGQVRGAALALMAASGVGAGNLIVKHVGSRVDVLTATAWQYLFGAGPLLVLSLLLDNDAPVAWSPRFFAGLLFLALIGSAGASWLWYRLVSESELIALNALTLLTPVFALLLALIIYREPIGASRALGVLAVLVGVTWVGWPRESQPAEAR